jgi:hypothetical protein
MVSPWIFKVYPARHTYEEIVKNALNRIKKHQLRENSAWLIANDHCKFVPVSRAFAL